MYRRITRKLYQISQYATNDDILETRMKNFNIRRPPQKIIEDIINLKYAAAQNQVVSLSSNQIRMKHRMFAILKSELIVPGKWAGYENAKQDDYRVIINPQIIKESSVRFKDFEECPSIPGLRFHIWNPVQSQYEYHQAIISPNEESIEYEKKQSTMKGFQSRIWDHQRRHLEGGLAVNPVFSNEQLSISPDYRSNYPLHELAQALREQLKFIREQNLIKLVKKYEESKDKVVFSDKTIPQPQNIPQKVTKALRSRMTSQYRKVTDMIKQAQKEEEK